jgi:hypothetical protein
LKVNQFSWPSNDLRADKASRAQLLLVFGGRSTLERANLGELVARFPAAAVVGCSTAGDIHDTRVSDDSLVITEVEFEHTRVRIAERELDGPAGSFAAGLALAQDLTAADLVHVLVLSDGLRVNGSALAQGLGAGLPHDVHATGGLAGDGSAFERTVVVNGVARQDGRVVAVGFYGRNLQVGFGSVGGWDPFGPDREVTRSVGNVVYEFDGQSALSLYKKYLGEHAAGLPASGLLFPLLVHVGDSPAVVRTILAIDEATQSLTFAGDVPQGSSARLMKANFDRLIDGAHQAADSSRLHGRLPPELAVL